MKRSIITTITSLTLLGVVVVSGLDFTGHSVAADNAIDPVNIVVPASCTILGTGMSSHNADIANGTLRSNIGETVLKATCNDKNGFAIYAVGFTDNEDGKNVLVNPALDATNNIMTGIQTGGDVSSWAMKLSADSALAYPMIVAGSSADTLRVQGDLDYSAFQAVPSNYIKVAYRKANTDVSIDAVGSVLRTTYQAYIGKTQSAGVYTGKVKYTLVHPATEVPSRAIACAPGKICYNANSNLVEGTMGRQEASDGETIMLLASNYSRTGYGFAGWSDAYDYETNPNARFYGPHEDIIVPEGTSDNGLSLYAVWIPSAGLMQDANKVAELCGNGQNSLVAASIGDTVGLDSVSALTDLRDGQTYAIAKLADGKCWMIENLRLDNTAKLTTLNTNNPLSDGDSSDSVVTLKHNYTDTVTYDHLSASSNVLYNADTAPDGWCNEHNAPCGDQSRLQTDNTMDRVVYGDTDIVSSQDTNIYSYGNYYNWYSATAGRGTHSVNGVKNNAVGDICPLGWHLPTGGRAYASGDSSGVNVTGDPTTYSEFYNLGYIIMGSNKTAYEDATGTSSTTAGESYYKSGTINPAGDNASKAFRKFPNNYLLAGNITDGAITGRGSTNVFYWSSTPSTSSAYAYSFSLRSGIIRPGTDLISKYLGRSVRCVATVE